MTWIIMSILLFSATLLQAMLPGFRVLAGARFPALLAVVLFYALTRKGGIVLIVAFLAGMIQDSMSMVPLGYSPFLFCAAALVAGRYRKLVVPDSPVTAAFFGGIASTAVSACLYFLLARAGMVSCGFAAASLRVIGSGLMGLISAPFVFSAAMGIQRGVNIVDERESPNAGA